MKPVTNFSSALLFAEPVNTFCITSLSLYCGLANGKELFIYAIVTENVAEEVVVRICRFR